MSGPSVPYAGNPSVWPPNVNVLSGSDTPGSAVLNTTSEGIIDRTAALGAVAIRLRNSATCRALRFSASRSLGRSW